MNRLGGVDSHWFNDIQKVGIRSSYSTFDGVFSIGSAGLSWDDRRSNGRRPYNIRGEKEVELNTVKVDPAHAEWIEELLFSPEIFFEEEEIKFIPYLCLSKALDIIDTGEGFVDLAIKFQRASPKRGQVL